MQLSRRLAAVADYVPPGLVTADIGTDHAALPVYLVEHGICPFVIAVELHEGPLLVARRAVAGRGLEKYIDVRCGDGLQALSPGEADVAVIAGLGGDTICRILAAAPRVLKGLQRLILQPMSAAGRLRFWLYDNGWRLCDERLVEDGGRIYVVIAAEPGQEEVEDDFMIETGPVLIRKKDPLLKKYLAGIEAEYRRVLVGLVRSSSPQALEKIEVIGDKLKRLEGILSECRSGQENWLK